MIQNGFVYKLQSIRFRNRIWTKNCCVALCTLYNRSAQSIFDFLCFANRYSPTKRTRQHNSLPCTIFLCLPITHQSASFQFGHSDSASFILFNAASACSRVRNTVFPILSRFCKLKLSSTIAALPSQQSLYCHPSQYSSQ